jgi:hypothetical protein
MKTLADFKRFLAEPDATLTLIKYAVNGDVQLHKYQGIPRKVSKLQTNSVRLATPEGKTSWLDFGKASEWAFDDELAVNANSGVVLIYRLNK